MNEGVRCYCRLDCEDLDMICCDVCGSWLHTVCCGFFSNTDRRVPATFVCTFCRRTVGRRSSSAALFRRLLSIAYCEGVQSIPWLCSRTGMSARHAEAMLRRMVAEGFVRLADSQYEAVATDETRDKIKRYFRTHRTN